MRYHRSCSRIWENLDLPLEPRQTSPAPDLSRKCSVSLFGLPLDRDHSALQVNRCRFDFCQVLDRLPGLAFQSRTCIFPHMLHQPLPQLVGLLPLNLRCLSKKLPYWVQLGRKEVWGKDAAISNWLSDITRNLESLGEEAPLIDFW